MLIVTLNIQRCFNNSMTDFNVATDSGRKGKSCLESALKLSSPFPVMSVLSLYCALKLGLSFKVNTRVENREQFLFRTIQFFFLILETNNFHDVWFC